MIPHKGDSSKIDADVNDAIQMTQLCKELRCLPRAGGLLDQDSYQVWLMTNVLSAMNEKEEQRISQQKTSAGKK